MQEKTLNTAEYIKIIKESPQKKRSYAFLAFTILVSILLVVFAIRPTIIIINKINKEIKEKTTINNLLISKIDALSTLDKEYVENQEAFENLELIFPANGNFSLLLANIDSVVGRNGFSLSSVSFDNYKGKAYKLSTNILNPQTIGLSVRGKESNLINLLKDIEALPMSPVVEGVSYSTQKDREGFLSFGIRLRVYDIDNDNFYR